MDSREKILEIIDNIKRVIKGQGEVLKLLVAGFLSDGHILLEDFPGTGKTTLAKTLAKTIGVNYKRVQFTPDLLPTDILGVSIYDQKSETFKIHKGPIFTNILLSDEINRASPRTQSALLESMEERQVSIDGVRYRLDDPFFVIATQNPIELSGTYPLPEAQLDRFAMKLSLGYISKEKEVEILSDKLVSDPLKDLTAVIDGDQLREIKEDISTIEVSDDIKNYIVEIVRATREDKNLTLGSSPRGSLTLMKIAQALAKIEGYNIVTPDQIKRIAVPVLAHRVILDQGAKFSGVEPEDCIKSILKNIEPPL